MLDSMYKYDRPSKKSNLLSSFGESLPESWKLIVDEGSSPVVHNSRSEKEARVWILAMIFGDLNTSRPRHLL